MYIYLRVTGTASHQNGRCMDMDTVRMELLIGRTWTPVGSAVLSEEGTRVRERE